MSRISVSISITESMKLFIDNRVTDADYGSISEYFRELISKDQQQVRDRVSARPEPQKFKTDNEGWLDVADVLNS